MTRYAGFCCGCVWDYVHGDITQEEWDAHVATIKKLIDGEYPSAETFLSITYSVTEITAHQRKQIMDVIRSQKENRLTIKGRALVVDSLVARAAILTLAWMLRGLFDVRVFAFPQPAFEWLAKRSSQFDAKKVIAEIKNNVASRHLWDKV